MHQQGIQKMYSMHNSRKLKIFIDEDIKNG